MKIIIYGDPGSGFTCVGPFVDFEMAETYGEVWLSKDTWWVTDLTPPILRHLTREHRENFREMSDAEAQEIANREPDYDAPKI
jgi:hypothetical protein